MKTDADQSLLRPILYNKDTFSGFYAPVNLWLQSGVTAPERSARAVSVQAPTTGALRMADLQWHQAHSGSIGADTTVWDAGDTFVLTGRIKLEGFSLLNANQLLGISLNTVSGADMTKVLVGNRLALGVDSAGDLFIVTGDGATVTATDTGFNITSGVAFNFRLTFVKGSYVRVSVDEAAEVEVTATLPTYISHGTLARGTSASQTATVTVYRLDFGFDAA